MKIKKIDVQTSNKKHATDIAMLVDKPEFLQALQKLREKWPKDLATYERLPEFNDDIDKLLKTFNRGKNFKSVVAYALTTGAVPEGVYKSCYFDVATLNEKEDINKHESYQYVIVMSPRTEKREVLQAYKEFEEHIKGYTPIADGEIEHLGKIKFEQQSKNHGFSSEDLDDVAIIEHYYKGNVYDTADTDKFKTQKLLERTRDWYWIAYSDVFNNLSPKRKRTEDVLSDWQSLNCPVHTEHDTESKKQCPYCSIEDINIVDQALSSYSKLLSNS